MTATANALSPPAQARRYLEPGPIILISSAHKNETDIMTCGWHMIARL
ncbi:MAG: hypothetical protein WDM81_18060 [Rhizomicrobium sp.]